MKTILAVFLALALFSGAASAGEVIGSVTYDVSFPAGDLRDFIDNESWRGMGAEGRWMVTQNISLGVMARWNTFYQKTSEMIGIENGSVSGNQYRIMYGAPMMATAHWYPNSPLDRPKYMPYVGVGVGTIYAKKRLEIGIVAIEDDTWHFGVSPEAGVIVPINYVTSLIFAARYNFAFEADEVSYDWWGFNVGFAWTP